MNGNVTNNKRERMEDMRRCSGILMPIFSLPGENGIGCFSKEAYKFVDFLEDAGQSMWQILPLGPTSYGDSPYQSFSTFAGNPYFIDLETLREEGLIDKAVIEKYKVSGERVHYGELYKNRYKALREAFSNFDVTSPEFKAFEEKNADWLSDYALFMAVKSSFNDISLLSWDQDIRRREPAAMARYSEELKEDILFHEFMQFEFDRQWKKLKKYANEKGIRIVGDIPIYVSVDSSDVWADPELFQLDENLDPTAVAGCPPDDYAKKGQLWGNPLYRWDYHKKTDYLWWRKRIAKCQEWYDIIRIDHFRGFDQYYSIPYGAADAVKGRWRKGPGYSLFKALKPQLEKKDTGIIAEDLGFITDSVRELVKRTGYPNMKVLEFAFDKNDHEGRNEYLPHNYQRNCIAYTGTHDNETARGWLDGLDEETYKYAADYVNADASDRDEVTKGLIRTVISSSADLAVIPMWDYLGLGNDARINVPSTLGDNWRWRMKEEALTKELAESIRKLCSLYGRSLYKEGKEEE